MNKVILGSILGAAALTAAAYIFDDENEENKREYDFTKKTAGKNSSEILKQLEKMDWDLIHLNVELASLYTDLSSLVGYGDDALTEYSGESFTEKVGDYIYQGSAIFLRGNFISKINEFRHKIMSLYVSYKDVIINANQFLKDNSLKSVSFKGVFLRKEDFEISNSIDNKDWDDQVNKEMELFENFINIASDRLKRLITEINKLNWA
ncbi:hypothetical protein SAMN02910357_01717 [Succinivibrio dextrinosolvens]|uniref:hypothetical protein n=1 Tax=Succinivibrio dextrinosolvens TaxID=83771 RepID=UPI0008EA4720|nr:hypothetical protein [Succinivibrio dextrinosolvens]SFS76731.1 hypothetical protein SAMN02910357_01717 [Succinivibrio dextrinosolvens]